MFALPEDLDGYRSDTEEDDDHVADKFQAVLEEETVKLNTINTSRQILKCDNYVLASETGSLFNEKLDLNVLCLLLTTSLRDSDPGYPVFIYVSLASQPHCSTT